MSSQPHLPLFGKDDFLTFLRFLLTVSFKRIRSVFSLGIALIFVLNKLVKEAKFFAVRKLLWGRGRLFRPVSHLSVISLVSAVLIFAPLLNSSLTLAEGVESAPEGDLFVKPIVTTTELSEGRLREKPIEYEVQPGDTLSSIGENFKVSVSALRFANDLSDVDRLSVGQKLAIPPFEGVIHKVAKGETVEELAQKYRVSPQAIVDANYLFAPFTLTIGQELVIPGATIPAPTPRVPSYYAYRPQVEAPSADISGTGRFSWPTAVRFVSQYFSRWHPAIDISKPKNGSIFAADSGRVVQAGWLSGGYGYAVKIGHGGGYETLYAHLSKIYVQAGEGVEKGQAIGQMGCTGRCWGQHVHFEIRQNGRFVNPLGFFK